MTRDFENMLYLFGCGAFGNEIKNEYCTSLGKIREIALKQNVWDCIYGAIREKILSGDIKIPENISKSLEQAFTANVGINIQKTEFNRIIVNNLAQSGVKCVFVKGTTVARLYKMPETRMSSDTDILIDIKNEKKVSHILEESGYAVEKRDKNDHHMKARHPIGGLLEVHVELHSKPTRDIIFNGQVHYTEEPMLLEEGCYTLGVNDNLLFLSAHLIKHLINDGAGVRQIGDLLLFMQHYENEIDWDKYWTLMKNLNYEKLILTVMRIGNIYFGTKFEADKANEEDVKLLLDDIEKGGVFGYEEKEREQFFYIYTKRRSQKGNAAHTLYRLLNSERSAIRLLFPNIKDMKKFYKYLEKHPYLLAVAWLNRIAAIIYRYIFKKNSGAYYKDKASEDIADRRLQLMKKLGMID